MAWTTITYSCGHVGQEQLYGKHDARERTVAARAKYGLCEECAAKERDAQNQRAAQTNAEAGLPSLSGTPKQIAWAESLRAQAYRALTADGTAIELLRVFTRHAQRLGVTPEMLKATPYAPREAAMTLMRSLVSKLFAAQTSASYWIDARPMGSRSNDWSDWGSVYDRVVEQFAAAVKAAPAKVENLCARVMRRAWAIAREAAKKLGVAVGEIVFGACLKQAWAEARA